MSKSYAITGIATSCTIINEYKFGSKGKNQKYGSDYLSDLLFYLLQNPPAIPTLSVAVLVCAIRGSTLVIDWHNFGYTILGMALGNGSPVVRIHEW